jgi:hypothetical protein
MIYIHETTNIAPGKMDPFVDLFEGTYQPLMEGLGARLVALWETVDISLPWPQTIALWEIDDIAHYTRIARARYQDEALGPRFRAWRNERESVSTGGVGRILTPAATNPTLAQLKADGLNAEICVHEWLTTQPDKQRDYVEQIERLWVPYAVRNGRRWIGTYSTNWKNFEAISIWALEKGLQTMDEHYSPEARANESPADKADLHGWMAIAISLRERFDDGLLHALRPTPLR